MLSLVLVKKKETNARAPRQREKETGTKDTKRRRKKRRETVYFWNSWNEVKGRVVARQRIRMEYILMDDRPTNDFVTLLPVKMNAIILTN